MITISENFMMDRWQVVRMFPLDGDGLSTPNSHPWEQPDAFNRWLLKLRTTMFSDLENTGLVSLFHSPNVLALKSWRIKISETFLSEI